MNFFFLYSYLLILIDVLDILVIMGNYIEFRRVVELVIDKMNFDFDINVLVFEINIRSKYSLYISYRV